MANWVAADKTIDVIGIGNAIVDVLSYCEDAFLEKESISKGTMTLVDEVRSKALYDAMGQTIECSGGSVANSLAAIAGLGGNAAFVGKVFDDQLGAVFRHDMRSIGVGFDTPATDEGKATGVCLINVTPDAQRSMCTYIGACSHIHTDDVDHAPIAEAKILYLEGYLWDEPETKNALRHAARSAEGHGTKIALSLSDPFCVERHREEFIDLLQEHVDWVFCNEEEALSITDATHADDALNVLSGWCEMVALTRGAHGSLLRVGNEAVTIRAIAEGEVVDTTGAGDLYAAGVLYGLAHGYSLADAGALGSRLAGHIITQLGARSQKSLAPYLPERKAA